MMMTMEIAAAPCLAEKADNPPAMSVTSRVSTSTASPMKRPSSSE